MSIINTNIFLDRQLKLIFDATENNDSSLPEHQYNLGMAYKEGNHGLNQHSDLAFKWFEKAANGGHIQAQFKLAAAYKNKIDVDKDRGLAKQWLTKAAYACAITYAYGIDVTQNSYLATKWYAAAARRGLPEAQFALAEAYMHDDGVERNFFLASKWYKAAADQGHREAALALEKMYLRGLAKRPVSSEITSRKTAFRTFP